jgi:hypothetical protein
MLKLMLAAVGEPPLPSELQPGQSGRLMGMAGRDIVLILGAAAVLALVLFLWVYLTRKERRHRSEYGGRVLYRTRAEGDRSGRRRRRRRHRPDEELPRNPTLQETGGLPPVRPDEPAAPTSSPNK